MFGPSRHRIVGLVFLLALINHIDRANISIAAPVMMRELGWREDQFGIIFSAFVWGYMFLQLPGGYVADRLGGRLIPFLCVGWSLATFLTPLGATALPLMLVLRFLVGGFEAPIVPVMSITNAAWVPRHELARAQTIIPAALNAGIMIGYPLVTSITLAFGWRWVFYLCGGIGIVWVFLWLWYGRGRPEDHPSVSAQELTYIQAERTQPVSEHSSWGPILRSPRVWTLAISYTLLGLQCLADGCLVANLSGERPRVLGWRNGSRRECDRCMCTDWYGWWWLAIRRPSTSRVQCEHGAKDVVDGRYADRRAISGRGGQR